MFDGLLQPRSDEPRPWLMPIMRASRGTLHGDRRRLYPRKTIWVDPSSPAGGDGSAAKPLRSLDAVFSDDTLECVCRSLCCDRLTVRVKGPVTVTADDTVTRNAEDVVTVVNGISRDYARHLVIRPWTDGEHLTLQANLRTYVTVSQTVSVDFRQYVAVVRALRGVTWIDTDAVIDLVIVCDRDPEEVRINALAELGGWTECADSVFLGCTVTTRTRVDVLMKRPPADIYPTPPGPGGGDGSGGGSGGGGGTGNYPWPGVPGGGGASYPWPTPPGTPSAPALPPFGGEWNAATLVYGIRDSARIIARGGMMALQALAQSNWGAVAECRGIVACPDSNVAGMTITTRALAEAQGSGSEYLREDGSRGVAPYQLLATAQSRDVALCPGSTLNALLGNTSARAATFPGNQPHNIDADGQRTDYAVQGHATAEAYGMFSCPNSTAEALHHTATASAVHPTNYARRSCPFAGNVGATFSACTGAGASCASNRAGWCGETCDAV